MASKKWFDPLPGQMRKPSLPYPIGRLDQISTERVQRLLTRLCQCRRASAAKELFSKLADMLPAARLSRNLKEALTALVTRDVDSVIRDTLREDEKAAVVLLEEMQLEVELRETAQILLNISERYELVVTWGRAFQDLRQ
jgi:phenylpyruvate tautomerase PptA (4-oxalocrotonate tautomerase family)